MSSSLSFALSKIVFSSGDMVSLDKGDLLVIVGPNNSGKSSSLREIVRATRGENIGPVIKECEVEQTGSFEVMRKWFEDNTHQSKDGTCSWTKAAVSFQNEPQARVQWNQPACTAPTFSKFFTALADTESRLSIVKPPASIAAGGKPSHPFHVLFNNLAQESKVSEYFKRAFNTELVLQRLGNRIGFHCGAREEVGDTVQSLIDYLPTLPELESQGDGMRSFAGTISSLVTSPGFIHLIDEPEAFLHPPQARELGRIIAEVSTADPSKQIVISTHSGDFLRGLIESDPKRLKVARITRSTSNSNTGEVNRVKMLDVEQLKELWGDPVLRFSNSLDAIFHEGCLISEYEADCQFYSAVAEATVPIRNRRDLMYIGSGGKSGMKKLVKALVALGVPTAIIADFDILNDVDPLKELYRQLGGDWSSISDDWTSFNAEVISKKPALTTSQVRAEITAALNDETEAAISNETVKRIGDSLKSISPWSEPKRLGLGHFAGGTLSKATGIVDQLAAIGLYAVPVGEMEGFAREFQTGNCKGAKWVAKVLRGIPLLKTDPRLKDAREFVQKVNEGFMNGSSESIS